MYLDQVLEFEPNTGLPLEITFGEGYPKVYKDLFKLIKMTGRQFLSDRIRYGNE